MDRGTSTAVTVKRYIGQGAGGSHLIEGYHSVAVGSPEEAIRFLDNYMSPRTLNPAKFDCDSSRDAWTLRSHFSDTDCALTTMADYYPVRRFYVR